MASSELATGNFAVVVFRDEGRSDTDGDTDGGGEWQAGQLPDRLVDDLDGLIAALRQQPGSGGSIGLVNIGDEFFVVIRVRGDVVRILLSDVTASVAWDLAKQVVERLQIAPPEEETDVEEVWPAGDLSIFSDLGLDEMELGAILADLDAYADEMLVAIAGRVGFADAYLRAVDAASR